MTSRSRFAIWVVAVGAGIGLAVATSEFEPGVPATALGLVALAVVVGAAALLCSVPEGGSRRWTKVAVVGLLVALGVVASQDFLRPGVAQAHDLPYHSWALFSTWRSVLDGDLWPRWNPYLGLGMPLLQFYCPLGYTAAWPAQALGASPIEAVRFLVVLGQVGAAATTFASIRWAGGSRAAAILAAGALALAPYHLMDQTFRFALGEYLSFVFLPPLAIAAVKVARGERGRAPLILGLCTAALLLTHLLSLIMVVFTALPAVLWTLARRPGRVATRRRSLVVLSLTAALTVGVTAAWWLPVVAEQGDTAVARLSRPGRSISPFASRWDEPVRRRAWPRYGVRRSFSESDDPGRAMPMYFGCVLLALLLLALAAPGPASTGGPTQATVASPRLWALSAALALLLAIHPIAVVLDGFPVLGRIMFPWRLYAPATVYVALAAGFALDRWAARPGRSRTVLAAVALAALAFDVVPYLGSPARYGDHEGQGMVVFNRLEPVSTTIQPGAFVRVENAPLPPTSYDFRVAKARRIFPEYMSVELRERYGKTSKPPSIERSESYGASVRFKRHSGVATELEPDPLVWFRAGGGRYEPLAEATWDLKPERVTIQLPAGLPEGNVRFVQGWFPGWRARVDGGPWSRALRSKALLAAHVPAGARTVELDYGILSPWDRPVGLLISALSLVAAFRLRRRSA